MKGGIFLSTYPEALAKLLAAICQLKEMFKFASCLACT